MVTFLQMTAHHRTTGMNALDVPELTHPRRLRLWRVSAGLSIEGRVLANG